MRHNYFSNQYLRITIFILTHLLTIDAFAGNSTCSHYLNEKLVFRSDLILSERVLSHIQSGIKTIKEIEELFKNQVSEPIPELDLITEQRFWFISNTDDQRRYKVILEKTEGPNWILVFYHLVSPDLERYYYRVLGKNLKEKILKLNTDIFGITDVVVSGNVQLKILYKHGLTFDQLIIALNSWDGTLQPSHHNARRKGSYKIVSILDNKPITLIITHDQDKLILLTAFTPSNKGSINRSRR